MAKRGKKGNKKVTTSKSKPSAGRGKASLAKKLRAANACCPIIRWKCEDVVVEKGKASPSDAYVYDSGKAPKEVLEARAKRGTRCLIRFGTRSYKNLDPAQKDDKISELKKALAEKRCEAVTGGID